MEKATINQQCRLKLGVIIMDLKVTSQIMNGQLIQEKCCYDQWELNRVSSIYYIVLLCHRTTSAIHEGDTIEQTRQRHQARRTR